MDELLQALDIAVVEELLLEVRLARAGLGSGTLRRRQRHIACSHYLELAVAGWRILYPSRIRVGRGTRAASEEIAQSQVSPAEALGIRGEPEEIRRGLIKVRIPRIQGQPFIGRAEAGKPRRRRCFVAGVNQIRCQS